MDRDTCGTAEERHPWAVDHPYIERVPGGWRQKDRGDLDHRYASSYYDQYVDSNVRTHPVIYKLFGVFNRRGGKSSEREEARIRFIYYKVVTDEEVAAVPAPMHWPPDILERWPELGEVKS